MTNSSSQNSEMVTDTPTETANAFDALRDSLAEITAYQERQNARIAALDGQVRSSYLMIAIMMGLSGILSGVSLALAGQLPLGTVFMVISLVAVGAYSHGIRRALRRTDQAATVSDSDQA